MDALQMQYCNEYQNNEELSRPIGSDILYPCSNALLHQNEGGIRKSIPDAQEISRARGSREISRAEGMDLPVTPEFWLTAAILFIINPSLA